MTITPSFFEAFLKCPTKCWLRSTGEPTSGNAYAEWVQTQNESYRADVTKRLTAAAPEDECAPSLGSSRREEAHYSAENLKTAKWRLAADVFVQTPGMSSPVLRSSRGHEALTGKSEIEMSLLTSLRLTTARQASAATSAEAKYTAESRLHAVERVPSEGRGKPAQFIPIRFIFTNKLGKDDKLLLAFDALVLSQALEREVSLGKIIHGDDRATLKVKTSALAGEVRKRLEKIAALLSSPAPPDLVLNRHCAECEFQTRCRQKALEKDDLSLLAGMKEDERKEYRSKGIFTATQLSYTFQPRRRPKHLRDKREKYHHTLKALAIREKKTYVVGSPELKIEGTPVYLDVEALPDLDFYYLIGARVKMEEGFVHHSFWADNIDGMARIWTNFLNFLAAVNNPCLIHYGSFETTFLNRMCARFGGPSADAVGAAHAIERPINLLSTVYAQVYFPTFSNGLKEIAGALGFKWSEVDASGSRSVMWRHAWNSSRDPAMKEKLVTYNSEDCAALALVEQTVSGLAVRNGESADTQKKETEVVRTDDLRHPLVSKWREFTSPLSELKFVNNAAHWDYQRDSIYVRSSK